MSSARQEFFGVLSGLFMSAGSRLGSTGPTTYTRRQAGDKGRFSVRWPCVFRHPIIRESVNPQLHRIDPATPYAAFQKAFRSEHCATLNPYGSESCPYSKEDCALAYLRDAQHTLWSANPKTRIGYFRKVTRSSAARRADEKPLARDTLVRTDGQKQDNARRMGPGDEEGRKLRTGRPRSLGSLFGDDDV